MVAKIHPYKQYKDAIKRRDRKPSASQDAVHYWWTVKGTKVAQADLEGMVDHYRNLTEHLEEMIGLYFEKMTNASADKTADSASGWGRYARMLELHNGV